MGYFDAQWNNLPSIFKIHSIVPIIGILIHTILMIPVLIETRKHEVQEIVQNPNAEQNHCSQQCISPLLKNALLLQMHYYFLEINEMH